jgi:hypothetical protein
LVLALFVSVWYVVARPKSYQTSATVWFDTQPPAPSSIDVTTNGPSPAAQAQTVFQELVATRAFMIKVGHRSPLAAYVAARHSHNNGPTALFSKAISLVKKSGGGSPNVDDGIVGALSGKVTAVVVGPQVLRVTLTGADPSVAVGTLQGLVAEYGDELAADRSGRDQVTVQYYQDQLASATAALADANAAETAYLSDHPSVAGAGPTDPQLTGLVQATTDAEQKVTEARNNLDTATQTLNSTRAEASFHVIDAPLGAVALSGKKKEIFAGVAGLFVGIMVTVLGLVALTASDSLARRREDLDTEDSGLAVVATIEQFSAGRESKSAARYLHRRAGSS